MRIAVIGAGGVGGYFGGRLAEAGNDVVFIARGETLNALRTKGLSIEAEDGLILIDPVQATDDPVKAGRADVIVLAVKAWQVKEVEDLIRPMMGKETCLLPLQNGVEAPGQLAEVFGPEHVLGGLCKIVSFIIEPGKIRHAGLEPYVAFKELDNSQSQRTENLKDVFLSAGIKAEIPEDIHAAMWEKFLFICSISGLGAVTRCPIGPIRNHPATRSMLEQAMKEIFEVSRGREIHLEHNLVERTMSFVDGLPSDSTASMQRDIVAGRPSELEFQNGAVVRLGMEAGIETIVNKFIYDSLILRELTARGQLKY